MLWKPSNLKDLEIFAKDLRKFKIPPETCEKLVSNDIDCCDCVNNFAHGIFKQKSEQESIYHD